MTTAVIHKDGILLHGRRYNHPALQHHLYEVVSVQRQGDNQAIISIDSTEICIADVQPAATNPEPKVGDKVRIVTGIEKGKTGTLKGIGYFFRISLDNDLARHPYPYRRSEFEIITGAHHDQ